ncbi:MAG: hypothetical protein HC915_17895 [Anaerolineae bacterium]|nr:hypothetical protein [Anaerolineae bacterium]
MQIASPPPLAQRVLADLIYAPGAVRRFSGHEGSVTSLEISRDGQTALSGGADGTVVRWDLRDGSAMTRLVGHTSPVTAVAVNANGSQAATGACARFNQSGDTCALGEIILWDLETGTQLRRLQELNDEITALAFSNDEQFIMAAPGMGP